MAIGDRYRPGSVQVHTCDPFYCSTDTTLYDGSFHNGDEPGVAYLPHQCDCWTVGGTDDVRALIADLQAALQTGRLK